MANPATLTISLKIKYIYKQEYIRKKPRLPSRNIPAIKVMENTPDQSEENILFSRKQKLVKSLPEAKISDIKSMPHLMPTVDQEYYKTIDIFKLWFLILVACFVNFQLLYLDLRCLFLFHCVPTFFVFWAFFSSKIISGRRLTNKYNFLEDVRAKNILQHKI